MADIKINRQRKSSEYELFLKLRKFCRVDFSEMCRCTTKLIENIWHKFNHLSVWNSRTCKKNPNRWPENFDEKPDCFFPISMKTDVWNMESKWLKILGRGEMPELTLWFQYTYTTTKNSKSPEHRKYQPWRSVACSARSRLTATDTLFVTYHTTMPTSTLQSFISI